MEQIFYLHTETSQKQGIFYVSKLLLQSLFYKYDEQSLTAIHVPLIQMHLPLNILQSITFTICEQS